MNRRKKLVFGLVTLALVLGTVEFGLRVRERLLSGRWDLDERYFLGFNNYQVPIYAPHPYLRRGLKAGFDWTHDQTMRSYDPAEPERVRTVTVHINELGFRGAETTREKPEGVYRIVCLGGSSTFGVGSISGDEKTWPALLEGVLGRHPDGRRLELINAGVPGFNTQETLIRLAFQVLDLDPDLLVLYLTHNDVVAAVRPNFKRDYSHYRLANVPEPDPWVSALERSFLFLKLRLKFSERVHGPGPRFDAEAEYADPPDPAGLETYARNIRSMIGIAKAHEVEVLIATEAVAFDDATPPKEAARRGANKLSKHGMRYLDVIRAYHAASLRVAESEDVAGVDSAALLPKEGRHFFDFVHLSDAGNQALAELLGEAVRTKVWGRLASRPGASRGN